MGDVVAYESIPAHLGRHVYVVLQKLHLNGKPVPFRLYSTSRIKDGHLDIVASTTRQNIRLRTDENESQEDQKIHRYNKVNRAIVSSLSVTRTSEQVDCRLEAANAIFSSDLLNEGATIDPQAKFVRHDSLINSGLLKDGEPLLDLVKSTYDGHKSNRGNTSGNHRSATNEEVISVNDQIICLVPTRRPEPGM